MAGEADRLRLQMEAGEIKSMFKLKEVVQFFSKVSKTKEEAFLKGFLMGLGSHLACPMPHWELMKEYPSSIDVQQEMREIFEKIHKGDIEEAQRLLAEDQGK